MMEIINYLKARYLSEKAQGIVEYALLLAFVVIVALAITNAGGLKEKVSGAFNNMAESFNNMK